MKKLIIGFAIGVLSTISGVASAIVLGGKNFPDVPQTAFYYNAVQDMSARGVINGYDNGNFGPEDNVTRGQVVVMLSQYNKQLGTTTMAENPVGDLIDIICSTPTITFPQNDLLQAKRDGLCLKRIPLVL